MMIQLRQMAQQKLAERNLRLVGLGGIGGIVTRTLARFLNALAVPCTLYVIDGDTYEPRNRERMAFRTFGNKAIVTAQELAQEFEQLTVLPVSTYATPENIAELITSGDLCFLMVDNHATRHLVATHCEQLHDIVLLSGGNDGIDAEHAGTFGNCQIFVRREGVCLTNPLTRFHPEIAQPQDQAPYALSCAELLQAGAGQLLMTNLAVASAMLNAFLGWLVYDQQPYEEVYLDVLLGRVTPVQRPVV